MSPLLFPENTSFWYETLRTLGHASYGGADIGEVLATAQAITAGDYDSWYDQWLATADWVSAEAEKMVAEGHRISARDGAEPGNKFLPGAQFFPPCKPRRPPNGHGYNPGPGLLPRCGRSVRPPH